MTLIEILKVIVFGIIEGFAEWIPVSATGHMMLIDEMISPGMTDEFKNVFLAMIRLGAVAAVVIMNIRKLNPLYPGKKPEQRRATLLLWAKIMTAAVPAGILGLCLDSWINEHLYNEVVVAVTLIVYGILLILVEERNRYRIPAINRLGRISFQTAFYLGIFQCLALIPGTSRSGAMILGALIFGVARPQAVEFSMFAGIPVIVGSGILRLIGYGQAMTMSDIGYILIGALTAFAVSIYSISFMMNWVRNNNFKLFGSYRIVLGSLVILWFSVSSLMK